MTRKGLLSWGNFPRHPQIPHGVHWPDDITPGLDRLKQSVGGGLLAFGSGMSYGDSCLAASDRVLAMRGLDRFISADWNTGVLRAQAGATLGEVLAVCIPRGWFLPVTPGTRFATLGGAVANDVHGKNHHRRGTFGRHVRRLGLVRSDTGRVTCGPDEQVALFNATIGGLGLTGVIEWVEIQLVPVRSTRISGIARRFAHLDEFFALSDEHDQRHEFSVSWVDCLARGRQAGRGVYTAGDFADSGGLQVDPGRSLSFPVMPPVSLVNRASLRVFNSLYWRRFPRSLRATESGYAKFFYPLDGVARWNRIYGPRGFQQYQCVVPDAQARDGIRALLDAVSRSGSGSFLAVLKRCGDAVSPGLLSFPMPGITLALDFPNASDLETGLFHRLDAMVREMGGRLYPAKDAHMRGEDFRLAYPAWQQVEALRDPLLLSRFWARVTRC